MPELYERERIISAWIIPCRILYKNNDFPLPERFCKKAVAKQEWVCYTRYNGNDKKITIIADTAKTVQKTSWRRKKWQRKLY